MCVLLSVQRLCTYVPYLLVVLVAVGSLIAVHVDGADESDLSVKVEGHKGYVYTQPCE